MIAFTLAVSLLVLSLACPGVSQQEAKFFLCPSYREIARDGPVDGIKATERNDPLWLLEKEDEWIPFRSLSERTKPIHSDHRHQSRTFRCIFYYLATFSNFMLDLFTPTIPVYYIYPYYRLTVLPQGEEAPSTDAQPVIFSPSSKPLTS